MSRYGMENKLATNVLGDTASFRKLGTNTRHEMK